MRFNFLRCLHIFTIFVVLLWIYLLLFGGLEPPFYIYPVFNVFWGLVALFSSIIGLKNSKDWGGLKSYMGIATVFISLGLLNWFLAQIVWTYALLFSSSAPEENPLVDLAYLPIDSLYTIGLLYLLKTLSAGQSIKSNLKLAIPLVFVPTLLFILTFYLFNGLDIFQSTENTFGILHEATFLFGSAMVISLTFSSLVFSFSTLGGAMKHPILLILCGFVLQYVGDVMFFSRFSDMAGLNNTSTSISDLIYLLSVIFVSFGILKFKFKDGRVPIKNEPVVE